MRDLGWWMDWKGFCFIFLRMRDSGCWLISYFILSLVFFYYSNAGCWFMNSMVHSCFLLLLKYWCGWITCPTISAQDIFTAERIVMSLWIIGMLCSSLLFSATCSDGYLMIDWPRSIAWGNMFNMEIYLLLCIVIVSRCKLCNIIILLTHCLFWTLGETRGLASEGEEANSRWDRE